MKKRYALLFLLIAAPFLMITSMVLAVAAAGKAGDKAAAPIPAVNVEERPLRLSSPLTSTTRYTVTDLGGLGGNGAWAYGLNEWGQVVGRATNEAGHGRAFLWLPEPSYGLPAGMNDLGLGGSSNGAVSINEVGQIIGYVEIAGGGYSSLLWQSGAVYNLGPGGLIGCVAMDVNNSGKVAACATFTVEHGGNTYTTTHASLWQGGGMSSLGTLNPDQPALYSYGNAINNAGRVVGSSQINYTDGTRAFFWDGAMTNLGSLAGDGYGNSYALDINEANQVVGYSGGAAGGLHAVLWLPAPAYGLPPGINDLGTLTPGGGTSFAQAINNNGQVVGSTSTSSSPQAAFVWEDGEMVNLNERLLGGAGWNLQRAMDINDAGQIVGYGTLNGQTRAFLLTPDEAAWTLMFYLDGDNDLFDTYPLAFNQLETAADNPNVNVVVLWDSAGFNDSVYYHVQHDLDLTDLADYVEDETMWSQGELDMSDPTTLSDFAVWAMAEFPAKNYALILDNHGSGLGGGLVDSTSGATMSLAQMDLALTTIVNQSGRKLDVLYMAMCLMGMIEDAYQFRGLTDYYVANQDLQWALSAPYHDYVAGVSATTTPAEMANLFAAAYADEAQAENVSHTISVVDMVHVDSVATAAYQLGAALELYMMEISPTVTAVLTDVQRFDNKSPDGITMADTYIDLYHFAYLASVWLSDYPEILSSAEAVMTAVDQAVLYERHGSSAESNLDNSHGISIFFPATASSFYHRDNYTFAIGGPWDPVQGTALAGEASWAGMLGTYFQATQPNGPDDPTPPEPATKLRLDRRLYLPTVMR